jgi:stress responsive alpha/beta barrel protein
VIRHIVLFTLKPEAADELPALLAALQELRATVPQVLDLACGLNLAASPYTAALTVDVASELALEEYRAHPEHQPVLELLRAVADRIDVADVLVGVTP